MLPVPMLPVINWALELDIGNTFTLVTLTSSSAPVTRAFLQWAERFYDSILFRGMQPGNIDRLAEETVMVGK